MEGFYEVRKSFRGELKERNEQLGEPVLLLSKALIFEATPTGEHWKCGLEVSEIRAFSAGEIPWRELAFWTATYALQDWSYAREHGLVLPRVWRVGPPRRAKS